MGRAGITEGNWWTRNAGYLRTTFRSILGLAWIIDGSLKFTSGYTGTFLSDVQNAQSNTPSWLGGWYAFWITQATNQPHLIVSMVGTLELLLGVALLFGFLRKIVYLGGIALSLLIWAVPEGFGTPYGPGSGATDIGTGAIYAIAFLGLIALNATCGPSRYSVDHLIERALPSWATVAEFGGQRALPGPAPSASRHVPG